MKSAFFAPETAWTLNVIGFMVSGVYKFYVSYEVNRVKCQQTVNVKLSFIWI